MVSLATNISWNIMDVIYTGNEKSTWQTIIWLSKTTNIRHRYIVILFTPVPEMYDTKKHELWTQNACLENVRKILGRNIKNLTNVLERSIWRWYLFMYENIYVNIIMCINTIYYIRFLQLHYNYINNIDYYRFLYDINNLL